MKPNISSEIRKSPNLNAWHWKWHSLNFETTTIQLFPRNICKFLEKVQWINNFNCFIGQLATQRSLMISTLKWKGFPRTVVLCDSQHLNSVGKKYHFKRSCMVKNILIFFLNNFPTHEWFNSILINYVVYS